MTRVIGSFGVARQPVDLSFGYFGETIRVHPDASDLAFFELMGLAQQVDLGDVDPEDPSTWDPQTTKAMAKAGVQAADIVRQQIHPQDWDRFWAAAKANRQQVMDLMALSDWIGRAVTEASAGLPTGPSSGSSAGRRNTRTRSAAGSSSPGRGQKRALELLQGRPDLQQLVVLAGEARTGTG